MEKGLIAHRYLTEIADAIRRKNKTSDKFKVSEMANAIDKIENTSNPNATEQNLTLLKINNLRCIPLEVCVMEGEVLQ